MLNFEMNSRTVDGGLVWELRGDLDLQTVALARAELAQIEDTVPALLIIDLSGLSFMDSTGLGVVVAAHARAIEQERRCVVVRPNEPVDKAFSMTGLGEVLDTVRSLAELEPPSA